MHRRAFLRGLWRGAMGGAALALAPKSLAQQGMMLQRSYIAGLAYYEGEKVLPILEVGMPLLLRREPDNPYDRRAVSIWADAAKLGYLPRDENIAAATLMDQGASLSARIAKLQPDAPAWERIEVEVWLWG